MTMDAGTRLGPYEVVDKLGEGGMGEVYRARDSRLDRDVAIKVLPSSFAADADRLARFESEAKAVGQLNHPNVLTVFDVGTFDGAPYLVMELLDGSTLRERLAEGALAPRKAIEWASQIALGLAAAHERGIIHRDLKPENVFVTRDGRVKILDFGLARFADAPGEASSAMTAMQVTSPGMVLGTVGYMAPEQVRGQAADARSDLFAVGVTLYEMLTGTRAFQRDSAADTMAAILKEEPPDVLASGRPIPPAADRIVRRCLEKQPGERFQSARDLAFALDAIGGGSSSTGSSATVAMPAPTERHARAWTRLLLVGAAGILAGGLVTALVIGRHGASDVETRWILRQLTFDAGDAREASLSPDGSIFVFVDAPAGKTDIFLQRVGGENPIDLTRDTTESNRQPAFSPDGKLIAFRSDRDGGGIFVMGATGESVRRLTDKGFNPAWSPDSASIYFATEGVDDPTSRTNVSALWRVDLATGAATKVFDGDAVQPSVSPDGKRIAFWGLPTGTGHRALFTIAAAGGTPAKVLDDGAYNWSPKWTRDGSALLFASNRGGPMAIWQITVDPSGAAVGTPRIVAAGTETYRGLSELTSAGLVFPSEASTDVIESMSIDPATGHLGAPRVRFRSSRELGTVRPSPDEQYLAMSVDDTHEDVVVSKADGTGSTRLTNDAARDRGPTWTPDSQRLFFYSDRSGQYEVWTVRKDGSDLHQITHRPAGSPTISTPILSPDGKTLAINTQPGLGFIDVSNLTGEPKIDPLQLPPDLNCFTVAWSPDSRALAGNPMTGSRATIIYSLATRTAKRVPGVRPISLLDDHTILGLGSDSRRLLIVDANTGAVRQGDLLPEGDLDTPALSRDLKTLYVTVSEATSHIWLLAPDSTQPRR